MGDRRSCRDRRKIDRDQEINRFLHVIFDCGDYHFAIAKDKILAISVQPSFVPMPHAQPWFVGICSIQGYVVSVTNLSEYLGLSAVRDKAPQGSVLSPLAPLQEPAPRTKHGADSAKAWGHVEGEYVDSMRVLLLKHEGGHVGLLVDAVLGVMECQPCERSRALYPLDVEQYMLGQRCADGQCYDEFDWQRLLSEQRFLDAIDDSLMSSSKAAP